MVFVVFLHIFFFKSINLIDFQNEVTLTDSTCFTTDEICYCAPEKLHFSQAEYSTWLCQHTLMPPLP